MSIRRNFQDRVAKTLAQKAGGPTERIEIQSTSDNIDYVIKAYVLRHANAPELVQVLQAGLDLEGGSAFSFSTGDAGAFIKGTDADSIVIGGDAGWRDVGVAEFKRVAEYKIGETISILVITMPEWMVPFMDETIATLDRADFSAWHDGTYILYVRPKYRLPTEIAKFLSETAVSRIGIVHADDSRQTLFVQDMPSYMGGIVARIKEYDRPALQIETRVRIVEIENNDFKKLGLDWNAIKDQMAGGGLLAVWSNQDDNPVVQPTGIDPSTGFPTGFDVIPGGGGSYDLDLQRLHAMLVLTPGAVADLVNWLVFNGHAKVVTDTRVTQTNGEVATVESVNVIPYVVRGFIAGEQIAGIRQDVPTNIDEFGAIREYREGVTLNMTPRIADDIQIAVSASVATLVGRTPNQLVPIVNENRVETNILLEPNKPAVIGGLIRESEVMTHKGLWLMDRIPFIGKYLFARKVPTKRRSLILMTVELEKAPAGRPPAIADAIPKSVDLAVPPSP